jgi:lysozyme
VATTLILLLALLVWQGVLWPTRPAAARYPVRGVDVSAFQGTIDWPVLAGSDLDFAYVKATEGSSFVDQEFTHNWVGAADAGLLVGAYHFLSFEAAHVIDTVPADGDLPVAIDVEYYGEYVENPPSADEVHAILDPLIERITERYGIPPVLYATPEAYDAYLEGAYPQCPIWIRSVWGRPQLEDGRDWAFWQYSFRDRRGGYDGEEPFVDMNVFSGSASELAGLIGPGPAARGRGGVADEVAGGESTEPDQAR